MSKRKELVAYACIQACCLVLLLAVTLKSQWLMLGVASGSTFPGWLIVGFDLAVVLLAIGLAKARVDLATCLLGIVFAGFSVFHIFNIGKPCGCFGMSNSTWASVYSNISIAIGLAVVAFVDTKPYLLFGMFMCFLAVGVSFFLALPQTNPTVIYFCDFVTEKQPFSPVDANSPIFSEGIWEVCVLESDCENCCNLARDLLGESHFLVDLVPHSKIFVVYKERNADFWELAIVRQSKRTRAIPVRLTIRDGKIVACTKAVAT